MKIAKLLLGVAMAVILAGCAAPSSQYYTLVPPLQAAVAHSQTMPANFAIRVLPVGVPEQVDRPQIMLSMPDSNAVTMLNGSLWASPLSEEIRHALSSDLSARLGVLDIPGGPVPESLPLWRIGVTVQRFDSVYGHYALLDATWRMDKSSGEKKTPPKICRAVVQVPVSLGVAAMVQGHQQALHYLADTIASQLSGKTLDVPADRIIMKGCA